ncbi:MAG: DNA polymerase III subunit delta [Fidelibacterota bacterium]
MKKEYLATIRRIRDGNVDAVYFLEGNDFFLQDYFVKEVEKALRKKGQLERLFLVPEAGDYVRILEELNSVPLFRQPKLLVLRNPVQIKGTNLEELLTYCVSPNPDNCLIILMEKADFKRKLNRKLSTSVGTITALTPFPDKLARWVKHLLKEHGLTATDDAVHTLIELTGDSLYHVANEIGKMALNLGERHTVEESDVRRYAGWKRSFYPWQFVDAVGKRDFSKAVLAGRNILDQGSDISMLISLMTSFFQELLFRNLGGGNGGESRSPNFWLGKQVWRRIPEYQRGYAMGDISAAFRLLARRTDR